MTTTTTVDTLIDKTDSFEAVRDKIALILAENVTNQMALATADGQDPLDWKMRIFTEAANPWELTRDGADLSPVVNVWYDNGSMDAAGSNIFSKQKHVATYNIDCYGFAVSEADGTGHKPGDKEASLEAQRAVRLVRNILMSAFNIYLGLQGTVWRRWIRSITVFQPQIDQRPVQNAIGARIAFEVEMTETSPQISGETMTTIATEVQRADDGEVLAEVELSV